MSNCLFQIGDLVSIRSGRCGTVVGKSTNPAGMTLLTVRYSDGVEGIFNCSRASPCQKRAATPNDMCGAPTHSGSSCSRVVMDGGRCWQHR